MNIIGKINKSAFPFALIAGVAGAVTVFLASSDASAGIEACGDINVFASAKCEFEVSGGCKAHCTPIAFEAACYGRCDGDCTASADVSCTANCSAGCDGACMASGGTFDCEGTCRADCQADCTGHCETSADRAECESACNANCGGQCDVSCNATPPEASCHVQCEASCSGECTAEANVDCQVECQGSCTADLQGGCEVQCDSPDGALFCDGQYVGDGGNIEECIAALNAILDADIEWSGSCESGNGSASCEAEASASCGSIAGTPGEAGAVGGLVAGLGLVAMVRRRRRRG